MKLTTKITLSVITIITVLSLLNNFNSIRIKVNSNNNKDLINIPNNTQPDHQARGSFGNVNLYFGLKIARKKLDYRSHLKNDVQYDQKMLNKQKNVELFGLDFGGKKLDFTKNEDFYLYKFKRELEITKVLPTLKTKKTTNNKEVETSCSSLFNTLKQPNSYKLDDSTHDLTMDLNLAEKGDIQSLYDDFRAKKEGAQLSPTRIRRYAFRLLKGLRCMHKNGYTHGDIKLNNLFIKIDEESGKRKAILGDFGESKKWNLTDDAERVEFNKEAIGDITRLIKTHLMVLLGGDYTFGGNVMFMEDQIYEDNADYSKYNLAKLKKKLFDASEIGDGFVFDFGELENVDNEEFAKEYKSILSKNYYKKNKEKTTTTKSTNNKKKQRSTVDDEEVEKTEDDLSEDIELEEDTTATTSKDTKTPVKSNKKSEKQIKEIKKKMFERTPKMTKEMKEKFDKEFA